MFTEISEIPVGDIDFKEVDDVIDHVHMSVKKGALDLEVWIDIKPKKGLEIEFSDLSFEFHGKGE